MKMVDVSANRAAQKWTKREQLSRVLWACISPFFFLSPRPFWGWRRFLLRLFGARIGFESHVYPSVRITMPWNITIGEQSAVGDRVVLYALGPITLGSRVTVSQGAHICAGTHDWQKVDRPLLKSPVTIDDGVWICADAFIGPGVSVGEGAIVGARAVAVKDILPHVVAAGNPAKVIREL